MSYSKQKDDARAPGSARQVKVKCLTPRGGDAFAQETEKVKDAVRKIESLVADVRREANLLSTAPAHSAAKSKEKAHAAVRDARACNEAAGVVLQGLGRACTGVGGGGQGLSVEEQNSRKFMHQKLTENLAASLKTVDDAWSAFEAAEAGALRKQAASDSMKTPLVSAGSPGVDPSVPEPEPAGGQDLEAGQQAAAQDFMPPEAEMHAAIAEEYARDLVTMNQNMHHLQRAMVDLADTTRAQGEVLDNIESSMSEAAESAAGANQELASTTQQQRRGTKRFLWLLVAAGSFAAVAALFT